MTPRDVTGLLQRGWKTFDAAVVMRSLRCVLKVLKFSCEDMLDRCWITDAD